MNKISIHDLEVFYRVGVTDAEQREPQRLLLTLEIDHDFERAVAADDLAETIDYAALSRRLLDFGKDNYWRLIETLAWDIVELVLGEFGARSVSVEVKKFVIPQARHVSVTVSRKKD